MKYVDLQCCVSFRCAAKDIYICMYVYTHIFFQIHSHLGCYKILRGFPGGSVIKDLPANAGDEGDVGSVLGQEDSLEEEMATHSSIPAWRIPWTEEPGGLQSRGSESWTQLSTQDTEYNSPCCIECPCYLFILHIVVQIF